MMCFFGEIWERFCKDTVLLEVVEEQFPFYVNLIFYTTTPRFAHPFFQRRGICQPAAQAAGTEEWEW